MTQPGQPASNLFFSPDERTEAFRSEVVQQLQRQSRSLHSIRGILMFFLILFLVGVLIMIVVMFANFQTGP